MEFISTDSLAPVTQLYNGLVDFPGEQAHVVEEILAVGILAEIMGKIAAGEGAYQELGLPMGYPLPDGAIRPGDLVRVDDVSERLYLCAVDQHSTRGMTVTRGDRPFAHE